MSIEAMKQAQAAIKSALDFYAAMFGVPVDSMLVTHHSEAKALFEACKAAMESLSTAIEQAEKRWSEFNETTKRNIEHADWYLSTHSAPEPVGVVKVLPLGDGHKPMHWADWTDDDNHPPEGTLLYTTPPAAPVQDECVVCGDKVRVIPRPWVGLTKEERDNFVMDCGSYQTVADIEAKLREKNGGQA